MSKKDKKTKLPKRIAGVKLPRELRKAGNALIETASSPLARQVIAAGLGMAAAGVRPKSEGDAASTPTAAAPPIDPHAIGAALGIVTQQVLRGLFGTPTPQDSTKP